MKGLQEAVFGVASSRITHPPSTEINLHTNALLREIFFVNPTTNHPPYQQMIRKAIEDLNEEGGSNEEIICSYIKTLYEHDVLPWGLQASIDNGKA
ncbi:Histone H1 [Melia azedarach]|uniref:Histone H1 n=1 Tax=Melia azedarach TaxID=155640 RepID=A0ACC1XQL9_MELAZ|nr:Histone H1 [Melia azedarach]